VRKFLFLLILSLFLNSCSFPHLQKVVDGNNLSEGIGLLLARVINKTHLGAQINFGSSAESVGDFWFG